MLMKKKILFLLASIFVGFLFLVKAQAIDSNKVQVAENSAQRLEKRVSMVEEFQRENSFFLSVVSALTLVFIAVVLFVMFIAKKGIVSLEQYEQQFYKHEKKLVYLESSVVHWNELAVSELASVMEKYVSFSEQKLSISTKDHSIVLELSRHIVNIENNLSKMNQEDGGVRRIIRAVQKIHDSFKSEEYELTPLLGTEIRDGQIIEIAQREFDPGLPQGKMIVSNVIKAQVLYQGEQIQRAKVDVKFNA